MIVIREISQIIEKQQSLKEDIINDFIKMLLYILIKYQGTEDTEYFCAC